VGLRRNDKTYIFPIGHLVLFAFEGPCPENCEMCHNDGNPTNDCIENLRWDTHAANMQDASRHGTVGRPRKHKVITEKEILANKAKAIRAKMVDSVSLGRRIKTLRIVRNIEQRVLAERVGLNQTSLSCIENDHVIPRPKNLLAILSELGWSEDMEFAFSILADDGSEPELA
jgi:DNA-binding XRE family transcriptional regulator